MMTKEERRQLRQIERELASSDPRLALLMTGGRYRRPAPALALLVLVDILAVAMIVLAVATGVLVLVFASSVVTVIAMTMHVIRKRLRTV